MENYSKLYLSLVNNPNANVLTFSKKLTIYNPSDFSQQKLLGHGQFPVFSYIHRPSSSQMAVKEISLRTNFRKFTRNIDPENLKRMKNVIREINILKTLKSNENVVNFYGYAIEKKEQKVLIFMELCGKSLDEVINEVSARHWYHVGQDRIFAHKNLWLFCTVGRCLLNAIDFCHDKQVLHGDIKPSNILFNSKGQAKLCDFGHAQFSGGESIAIAGTIPYWDLNCKNYDLLADSTDNIPMKSVDFYATAVTLLEVLYGRNPIIHLGNMYPEDDNITLYTRFKILQNSYQKLDNGPNVFIIQWVRYSDENIIKFFEALVTKKPKLDFQKMDNYLKNALTQQMVQRDTGSCRCKKLDQHYIDLMEKVSYNFIDFYDNSRSGMVMEQILPG